MKKDDLELALEELQKWKQEQEKEEAVKKATSGMVMLRCSTVVVTIWSMLMAIGAWAVQNFNRVEAAMRAFIETGNK
jgi:hypothetical protein